MLFDNIKLLTFLLFYGIEIYINNKFMFVQQWNHNFDEIDFGDYCDHQIFLLEDFYIKEYEI